MTAVEMQREFERRLQLMNPEFKIRDKLPSDTIFSFLNAYTLRFIRNNYLAEDTVDNGSRSLKKVQDALKGLVVHKTLEKEEQDQENLDICTDRFALPEDYLLYCRSNSKISTNYKWQIPSVTIDDSDNSSEKYIEVVPNLTIREDDVEKITSTYYNRAILVQPYAILDRGQADDTSGNIYLNIIHDTYTTIEAVDLVYYRRPLPFNVIGVDNTTVLDHCELPENVHMEIVEGAVEMFITEARYRLGGNPSSNENPSVAQQNDQSQ